ncbi:hypothetical protein [Paractinoplanes globisporus]|uniref:hypothetical protein n=1 Tax=Paractinoplanes globisporus TaxID=113565 RepID=UPI00035DD787|nr:hypothetical protein [Actinoplanes globisporus]
MAGEDELGQDDRDRDAEDGVVDQVELGVGRVDAEQARGPAGRAVQMRAGQALQGQALLGQAVGDTEDQQVRVTAAGAAQRLAQEQDARGVDGGEDQPGPGHPQRHGAETHLGDDRGQQGENQRGAPIARPKVGHPGKCRAHDRPVHRHDQRGQQRQLRHLQRPEPERVGGGDQLPGHGDEPGRRDDPHPPVRGRRARAQLADHPDVQDGHQEDQDLVGTQLGGVGGHGEAGGQHAGADARDQEDHHEADRPLLR